MNVTPAVNSHALLGVEKRSYSYAQKPLDTFSSGLGFATARSIFARTVEKNSKNRQ